MVTNWLEVSELWLPFEYGGWCQNAMIQVAVVPARSARSQVAIGPSSFTPVVAGLSTVVTLAWESRQMKWMFP